MINPKYEDLTEADFDALSPEEKKRIGREIESMITSGDALAITDEEEKMIRSFRIFKSKVRRDGEVFTWQTRRDANSLILMQ